MAVSTIEKRPESRPTISGAAAFGLIAFIAFIAVLAGWASGDRNAHRVIGDDAGIVVAVSLAGIFLLASLGSTLRAALPGLSSFIDRVALLFDPFGHAISAIDSGLAQGVAKFAGASFKPLWLRYGVLILNLGGAAFLSWWLQVHAGQRYPLLAAYTITTWASFLPLVWGFVVAFAISRRWAWVEQDRETAMITDVYEWRKDGPLRIGFDQDLRDEALLSLVFIFLYVPLGLSQLAQYGFFTYPAGFTPHYLDWLGFFGAELAKAAPFVDWAEVYDVGDGTRIEAVHGPGQHLVFIVRVFIDLILLAALLQALQVSSRLETQRRGFEQGRLSRLDPFLERAEFRRLAAGDAFAPTAPDFREYQPARLMLIASNDASPEVRAVAARLLWKQRFMGALVFLGSRLNEEPNEALVKLIAQLIAKEAEAPEGSRNLDQAVLVLREAIEKRNNTSTARTVGLELTNLLGTFPPPAARDALLRILRTAGNQDVRKAAIKQLMKDDADDPLDEIVNGLADRLTPPDRASAVRATAVSALKMRKSKKAVNVLGHALGWHAKSADADRSVRRRAVEALAEIGGAGAREALAHAAENEAIPAIKDAAKAALEKMGN